MGHDPPKDFELAFTIDQVPKLSACGIYGSTWHSEGAPVFCPDDDTSVQWPVLAGGGVALVISPRSRRIYRLG